LDPVYSGKAFAGLLDLVRHGYFDTSERILFLHTGGAPGLFAYSDCLSEY
jgi:1-aminocyclopropane-1-carboxylate deaminase/D-cysteine desulfhydrase-like pyridoxal-dependent ACC family enzyme